MPSEDWQAGILADEWHRPLPTGGNLFIQPDSSGRGGFLVTALVPDGAPVDLGYVKSLRGAMNLGDGYWRERNQAHADEVEPEPERALLEVPIRGRTLHTRADLATLVAAALVALEDSKVDAVLKAFNVELIDDRDESVFWPEPD